MQAVFMEVVTSSSVASPKYCGEGKVLWDERATVFCSDIACQSTKWQGMLEI